MIIRILIFAALVYLVFRLARGLMKGIARSKDRSGGVPPDKIEDLVEDPQCRRFVPLSEALKADLDGKTLYFCSRECLEKYRSSGGGPAAGPS